MWKGMHLNTYHPILPYPLIPLITLDTPRPHALN